MHFAIATTWGPTDTTRAALPFIFAASALQASDTVMIMLFHDAVTTAVKGVHPKLVPFGPPQRFQEVLSHPNAEIFVCKPCAEARGITQDMLVEKCVFGGMNDFHTHAARPDSKAVIF
jgi:sulfur relay (sulfurtransferase) complex TusBCD TusD component (DsrE family)